MAPKIEPITPEQLTLVPANEASWRSRPARRGLALVTSTRHEPTKHRTLAVAGHPGSGHSRDQRAADVPVDGGSGEALILPRPPISLGVRCTVVLSAEWPGSAAG